MIFQCCQFRSGTYSHTVCTFLLHFLVAALARPFGICASRRHKMQRECRNVCRLQGHPAGSAGRAPVCHESKIEFFAGARTHPFTRSTTSSRHVHVAAVGQCYWHECKSDRFTGQPLFWHTALGLHHMTGPFGADRDCGVS